MSLARMHPHLQHASVHARRGGVPGDGLVGMSFLEEYDFTVRPRDRQIHLEPVGAGGAPCAGQAAAMG